MSGGNWRADYCPGLLSSPTLSVASSGTSIGQGLFYIPLEGLGAESTFLGLGDLQTSAVTTISTGGTSAWGGLVSPVNSSEGLELRALLRTVSVRDTISEIVQSDNFPRDVRAFLGMASSEAISDLLAFLATDDLDEKRWDVIDIIGRESVISRDLSVTILTRILNSGTPGDRISAAGALADLNHPSALNSLRLRLRTERNRFVIEAIEAKIRELMENDKASSAAA